MNFFFTSVAGFNVTVIYKNGFMRKFLFFALSAIFTAGTPAGCNTDYNAISYFVWVNDSDHKITLFVESDLGCEFKNEVILPGESFTAMDNGMGVCPVPSSYIFNMYLSTFPSCTSTFGLSDENCVAKVSVMSFFLQGQSLTVHDKISTLRFAEVVFDRETLQKQP